MIELFREVELKMKHAVDHLHEELKHLRTGRASHTALCCCASTGRRVCSTAHARHTL